MKKPVTVTSNDNTIFINGNINKESYSAFMKEYNKFSRDKDITINLTTTGGSALFSYLFSMVLLTHRGKIIIKIPEYALSAGTIIALAGDELIINDYTFLSGINVVDIGGGIEYNQILKVAKNFMQESKEDSDTIATLISTYLEEKSSSSIKCHKNEINRILSKTTNVKEEFKSSWQFFDHDSLLDYHQITEIFKNVKLI